MKEGEESLRNWWSPENPDAGPAPAPQLGLPVPAVICHDITTWEDRCYAAWRDKGLTILRHRRQERSEESGGSELGRTKLPCPPFQGIPNPSEHRTHSLAPITGADAQLGSGKSQARPSSGDHRRRRRARTVPLRIHPLHRRSQRSDAEGNFRLPVSPQHARQLSQRPARKPHGNPRRRALYPPRRRAQPPGKKACIWGINFSDVHYPKAVAWYVPPVRSDSQRQTGHADDVFVMEDGVIFGSSSDQGAGGFGHCDARPASQGK